MPRGFAICVVAALFAVCASAADTDAVVPEEALVQDLEDAAAVKNCELVVEDCFASPSFPAAPAWTAPAATFSRNYNALCSDEAAIKATHERSDKAEQAQKKEIAMKGLAAEKASKVTEKRAKEAAQKMEKNAKINERNTKEASQKSTEREDKLFNKERQGKEVATKKTSEIASKTTIVPAPMPPPIPVAPAPISAAPVPAPVPVPVVASATYACDVRKCQCVVASKGPYTELPYCNEMCATTPGCTPVIPQPAPPPPLVIPKELLPSPPPPPPMGSAPVQVPVIPVYEPLPPKTDTAEVEAKSLAGMKEKLIKSREKFTKTQNELRVKNEKSAAELETKESTAKANEASSKEKAGKEARSKVKPVIVKQKVVKVKTHSVEWDIERGVKKISELKEKLLKAKAAGRIAIHEAYSKNKVAPVHNNNCAVTHQICGEIHAASIQSLAKAGTIFDKTAAELEANCAKTAAFEEKQADSLKFAVCQAAAYKMKELLHRIGGYTTKTVIIGNATLA
jgi:hypothetical protein